MKQRWSELGLVELIMVASSGGRGRVENCIKDADGVFREPSGLKR